MGRKRPAPRPPKAMTLLRRIRWQLIVTLVGLGLIVGLLFNLVNQQPEQLIITRDGSRYIEGLAGQVEFLNPLLRQSEAEADLISLVFTGLTRADEHGRIVPDLADDWMVMDNGLTYAFTLREDARWHDGTPVTADDVVFTIGLIQDESSDLLPDQAPMWRSVVVDKLDEHTVRFSLSEPLAPFLSYTTLPLLPAHQLHAVTAASLRQAEFNHNPVGSGPFRVTELNDEVIRLEAFEEFYGPQPVLSELEFRLYATAQRLLTAYENGEIQGVSQVLARDLDAAGQLPDLQIYSAHQARCVALLFNLEHPTLDDKRVREALRMGIDRRRLVTEQLAGQGVLADSPIFPGSWAYTPPKNTVRYDLEAARDLLAQAGWIDSDGDGIRDQVGTPLAFEIVTNTDPVRQAVADALAAQWRDLGVDASVRTVDLASLRDQHLQPREFDAVIYGWTQFLADPDPYPLWHSSQIEGGQNYAGLANRAIDNVLEAARRTTELEERQRLYHEFQQLFQAEVPALLLYYPIYHYGVDRHVTNVQLPQTLFRPGDRFTSLYRWYVEPEYEVVKPLRVSLADFLRGRE